MHIYPSSVQRIAMMMTIVLIMMIDDDGVD